MFSSLCKLPLSGVLPAFSVIVLMLAPAGAAAQAVTPTDQQYRSTLTQISQGGGGGTGDATANAEQVGGLPFTGLDLLGMLAVAACLAAIGLVLYRSSRHGPGEAAGR